MTDITIDVVGWIGAVGVLLAYGLISAGKTKADDKKYQGLNLVGAAALIVNSTWYQAYPSTFVNLVWIGIAVVALVGILRKQKRSRPTTTCPRSS